MDEQKPSSLYKTLGSRLKSLRNKANETLAEASGAVEIEVKQLASFEMGQKRPSEDILMLLISHFNAQDDEAVQLWELAGYGSSQMSASKKGSKEEILLSNLANEPHILFTDIVDIMVNNYGVVMNFMQSRGPNVKPVPVARVGMSREHAKSVLQILQITLEQTERNNLKLPKKLIAPDSQTPEDKLKNG